MSIMEDSSVVSSKEVAVPVAVEEKVQIDERKEKEGKAEETKPPPSAKVDTTHVVQSIQHCAAETRAEYRKVVEYVATLKGTVKTMRRDLDRLYADVRELTVHSDSMSSAMRLLSLIVQKLVKDIDCEKDSDTSIGVQSGRVVNETRRVGINGSEKKRKRNSDRVTEDGGKEDPKKQKA
eukprot:g478.t1